MNVELQPITHRDAAGNTRQTCTLDDGSAHEVLKNFPTAASALALLGRLARKSHQLKLSLRS